MIDENSRSLIPIRISKSGSRLNKIPKRVISLDHRYYRRMTKVSILVMILITWSSRGWYSSINYIRLKISHRVPMMVIGHLILICLSLLLNVRRFTMFIIKEKLKRYEKRYQNIERLMFTLRHSDLIKTKNTEPRDSLVILVELKIRLFVPMKMR